MRRFRISVPIALVCSLGYASGAAAQETVVPADAPAWTVLQGTISEREGRACVQGSAILPDVAFTDGVLAVDLFVTGARSYPGVIFRVQSLENYERFYIRPHRAGLYPDALQYTPVINRVAGWQLYNGDGYTAHGTVPRDQWFRLRLEVRGTQARVFLGDDPVSALDIHHLEHGASRGAIGVTGPADGSACFADFRYEPTDRLEFEPPPPRVAPDGVVASWDVSRAFKTDQADRTRYPHFFRIHGAGWETVRADDRGIVDVARYRERTAGGADAVMARTVLRSDRRRDVTLHLGYSDEVDLFLNGTKLFAGRSGYQSRDPSFLGIVGLYDALPLTLEPGLNEIFVLLSESFGGWGFTATIDGDVLEPLRDSTVLTKVWETPDTFLTPESVVYDPARDLLYVTSFDVAYATKDEPTGFISRLAMDGTILNHRWVTGLRAPTGLAISGDTLYTTERGALTTIDLNRGTVIDRYPIEDSDFLNDVVVTDDGTVYMTDTRPSNRRASRIYRYRDGVVDVWLDEGVHWSNGLTLHDGALLVGNSGDGAVMRVDLESKRSDHVVTLGARVLDGIKVDTDGSYLVSHWEGQVYRVNAAGEPVEILDLLPSGLNAADFEYIPDQRLLIIPTFLGNRVVAYRLQEPPGTTTAYRGKEML
jgi:sugar lactone lactonase YvrE